MKANFNEANLTSTDFYQADLTKTKFEKATLIGARFDGAKLYETKLNDANIEGASFINIGGEYYIANHLGNSIIDYIENLTIDQILEAKNWDKAKYNRDFEKQLQTYFLSLFLKFITEAIFQNLPENELVGQGKTPEQVIDKLKEAIESFLEIYQQETNIYSSPIRIDELHEFLAIEDTETSETYELRKVYA